MLDAIGVGPVGELLDPSVEAAAEAALRSDSEPEPVIAASNASQVFGCATVSTAWVLVMPWRRMAAACADALRDLGATVADCFLADSGLDGEDSVAA